MPPIPPPAGNLRNQRRPHMSLRDRHRLKIVFLNMQAQQWSKQDRLEMVRLLEIGIISRCFCGQYVFNVVGYAF